MGRTLEGKLLFHFNLFVAGVHLCILPKVFDKTLPASSAEPAALCTLHFPVSGSDVPLCSLLSRDLGSGRWQFLQRCGRCDKFETCIPSHVGARLESDMWIAVITGVHSRPFGLLEISLILTFGGSLVSFSCGWKCLFQWETFCARGKMDTSISEIFC